MTIDVTGILRDAWAMAKRDRQILIAVAGLLIFVPQFGVLLFWANPPVFPGFDADPAKVEAYQAASKAWLAVYGVGTLVAVLLPMIAQIAIMALYLDRPRPTVADALRRAPLRFFPVLLVAIVASPVALTLQILPWLILLAVYLQGRLLLTLPAVFAERPISVFRSIAASWRRTAGHGLTAAALVCITVIGGFLIATPFVLIGKALGGAPMANPAVALLLDGGAALGVTLGTVATFLVQIAFYRRLSSGT